MSCLVKTLWTTHSKVSAGGAAVSLIPSVVVVVVENGAETGVDVLTNDAVRPTDGTKAVVTDAADRAKIAALLNLIVIVLVVSFSVVVPSVGWMGRNVCVCVCV